MSALKLSLNLRINLLALTHMRAAMQAGFRVLSAERPIGWQCEQVANVASNKQPPANRDSVNC